MYTLFIIDFEDEKKKFGVYGSRLKAKRAGRNLKKANIAKKYRVYRNKKQPSPAMLRAKRRRK